MSRLETVLPQADLLAALRAHGLPPGSELPDPELSAHLMSAYADEAARLVLTGQFAPERILELSRWLLRRWR